VIEDRSRSTWAEALVAMARRQRLKQLWPFFCNVEVSQDLVETAGRFVDGFALRG
jgi:hypothetical protein